MRRTLLVLALAMVLLPGGPVAVGAQNDDVAEPAVESESQVPEHVAKGAFIGVAMSLSPDGHRHVVTSETFLTEEMLASGEEMTGDLWYATDRNGSWSMQRLLEGDGPVLGWTDASIAVDIDGSVHIAVVRDHVGSTPGTSEGIFYLTDRDRDPGDFGPAVRVTRRNMSSPSLAVVDGVRYLAYSKHGRPGDPPPPAPVFFQTDISGSWVTHRLADFGYEPSLQVDTAGRVHLIYVGSDADSLASGLRYVQVDPETVAPSKPRRIPGTQGLPYAPVLALGPSGEPHVAWLADDDIAWSTHTPDGWSRPEVLGARRFDVPSLAVDSLGHPHVVFVGRGGAGRGIIHAQRGAGTWHQSLIADGIDWAPLTIAMLGEDIIVAWTPGTGPAGLWSYGPAPGIDPATAEAHAALDALLGGVSVGDCEPFTERGENDPFSYGAHAAIACDRPARGVRQLALFRFPDTDSMIRYWEWRVAQIEPPPPPRDGACADGRRGQTRWEHGQLVCYVSRSSREAKLRWTDERTGTYGVIDARDRDIAGLHRAWLATQLPG